MAIPDLNGLISLAERVVKKAETYGAEEAESYVSWTKNLSATIQGGLVSVREGETAGVGVRAIIGKRVGFAAVSSIEEREVSEAASKALKVARIRPEDPKFSHLPDPVKRPSKSGIFDDAMLSVAAGEVLDGTHRVFNEAMGVDPRMVYAVGSLELVISQSAVANSRGINVGNLGTGMGGGIYCKAAQAGEERTGQEWITSRKLVDLTGVGETAAKRAVESLGARRLEQPKRLAVIFDNYTSPMLLSLLSYGVSARSVQEGRSALGGKLGERVAWKNLTIEDNSWMEEGLGTMKYDAEGIPTTVKPIIHKGVLKNYLYDSYTAHHEGKVSTGNARRGSQEGYLQLPWISPMNYYIEPGNKPLEDMTAEIEEGVLVRYNLMGAGHSNFISGDFSVVATNAFYVRDGAVAHPLHPVTIAGNAYDALKNVVEIGSDLRLSMTGKTPSILVSNLTCTP